MATNNDSRVTKDTSARKNNKPTTTHSAVEVAAIRASHEAYISSLMTGHEAERESLEITHGEEIDQLKNEHAQALAKLEASQQALINKAVEETRTESQAKMDKLAAAGRQAVKERNDLRTSLDEALTKNKTDARNASLKMEGLEELMRSMEDRHVADLSNLRRHLAITVRFTCKGRKERSILARPDATFADTIKELHKQTGSAAPASFYRVKNERVTNVFKTLSQLGINDDDTIECIK